MVPDTFDVNAILEALPLHSVCDEGVAVITGDGLTVTTTVVVEPAQLFAVGVMV